MNRIDLINSLIKENDYKSYLEIGCLNDECFSQVRCLKKVGVDPVSGGTLRMTSDEFFMQNKDEFDIIFVDGLHEEMQVLSDIQHSIEFLSESGSIIVHDCIPESYKAQLYPRPDSLVSWQGTVWKAILLLRRAPNLNIKVYPFDTGCGVITRGKQTIITENEFNTAIYNYENFVANKEYLLNIV